MTSQGHHVSLNRVPGIKISFFNFEEGEAEEERVDDEKAVIRSSAGDFHHSLFFVDVGLLSVLTVERGSRRNAKQCRGLRISDKGTRRSRRRRQKMNKQSLDVTKEKDRQGASISKKARPSTRKNRKAKGISKVQVPHGPRWLVQVRPLALLAVYSTCQGRPHWLR